MRGFRVETYSANCRLLEEQDFPASQYSSARALAEANSRGGRVSYVKDVRECPYTVMILYIDGRRVALERTGRRAA